MLNHLKATFLDNHQNTMQDNVELMTSCSVKSRVLSSIDKPLAHSVKKEKGSEIMSQSTSKKTAAKVVAIKKEPSYDFVGVAG